MTAPTPTDRYREIRSMYREIRSENLQLRRQLEELEMRLRLSNAREQKALSRAKDADRNSARWHALLLKAKIDRL